MRKFVVIALSVVGLKGRIFQTGEVVTEDCFERDHADELVKGKFLKEEKPALKTIDEVTDEFLKKELTEKKITFAKKATKEDLYNLWINA